jgi:hypothetical protein
MVQAQQSEAAASYGLAVPTPAEINRMAAEALGYGVRIPPQRTPFPAHGQAVFFNGDTYITRDVDSLIGRVWKMFSRRGQRLGTHDAALNRIGD